MPTDYRFITTISADTEEQAEAVMSELCGYERIETDLPRFVYEASWKLMGPWTPPGEEEPTSQGTAPLP